MAFVFTPTCPGTGPWYIDREDCIGDSLLYINANTGYLDCKISSLSTVPYTRLNNGNQTGNAPIYGCRAWVNFDAYRTESNVSEAVPTNTNRFIRGAGNVSSVLRNAAGDYTITFTVAMPNNNYCVFGSGLEDTGSNQPNHTTAISLARQADILTTSVRVLNSNIHPASPANYLVDGNTINVSVIC